MVNTRLILVNEQDTNSPSTSVLLDNAPTFENISVPITFQIADIREPGQGSGSYSKSIQIPGTQEVNIFFENIFDVNVSLQTFNPNLKVKAYYYVEDLLNFEGHLQILKINVDEVSKRVVYECNVIGEIVTLFTKIKDRFLTDLDFSLYNHNLTYGLISGSFANLGSNKAYPIIDYGTTNQNLTTLTPKDFRLCLFAREYMNKIFSNAGYTWTSTFLDSDFFKRLIVPPTTTTPTLPTATINNNKFLAVADGTEKVYNGVTMTQAGPIITYNNTSQTNVNFQSETYDSGAIFTTPILTPGATNKYNTTVNVGVSVVIKKNAVDISSFCSPNSGNFFINILKGSNVIATTSIPANWLSFGTSGATYGNIALNNVTLAAGQQYKVTIQASSLNITDSSYAPGIDVYTMDVTIVSGSNYATEFTTNDVYENVAVNCNEAIPPNIKQGEFVSWIFKKFNLYAQVDRTNSNNLIIEPRPDFYLTTAKDWSDKHDKGSGVEVIPMGELDFNKIKFTEKSDGDFFNRIYEEEYKEVYGTHREFIDNDFIKNEKTIETGFSATPYAVNPNLPLVTAVILDKKNNTVSPVKPNIRLLYYKQITLPNATWAFSYTVPSTNTVYYNTYPHAGHTDNPYSPTLDLNWGIPNKIYFTYPNQTWTTNNAYNKYYSQYINQITDKNSKIVRTRFYLNANDIHIFDFRYPIFTFINGEQGYYLVNKIEEYNPLVSESTMVELLKLTDYPVFTPTDYDMSGGLGGGNTSWERVANDNITKGDSNTNYGDSSSIIGGSSNYIAAGSEDIQLINSEEAVVGADYSNFVGVQIDENVTPENNTFNVQNSIITNKEAGQLYATTSVYQKAQRLDSAPRTSSFTVDGTKDIYYIDTSSGDITATIDVAAMINYSVCFVLKDLTNDFMITSSSSPVTENISGEAMPYTVNLDYAQYDSIRIHSDGTNLYKI